MINKKATGIRLRKIMDERGLSVKAAGLIERFPVQRGLTYNDV